MLRILLPILLIFVFFSCKDKNVEAREESGDPTEDPDPMVDIERLSKAELEVIEAKDIFGNKELISRRKDDLAKEGLYQKFTPEGVIMEKAYYLNDSLHGIRVLFYEDGDTMVIERHRRGIFDGPYIGFYENGVLQQKGTYVNNTMSGDWERYYETGELMEIVRYENNQENGPFKEFHKNGHLKAEGTYLKGDNEHGELIEYDENGNMTRKLECNQGVCNTVWKAKES